MSSLLKNKVEEDLDAYSQFLELTSELFEEYEENSLLDLDCIQKIFKKVKLTFHEYLLFKREGEELIREALKRIRDEEDVDQSVFLQSMKRAFLLNSLKEDIDYIFQTLSDGASEVTRESFVKALEKLPPLKANQNVIQAMLDMADGFPMSRASFEKLIVITGYIDQRINAFDSVLKRKNRGKARKKSKIEK